MGNHIKIGWIWAASTGIDALTDDLLELILLRLNSPVCLVRAAATCRLWRRLIADAGFLRRVRHLLPPPVLGYYLTSEFSGATFFVDLAGELHEIADSDDDYSSLPSDDLAGELHETADDSDDELPPPTDDHDNWFSFSLDFLPPYVYKMLLADSRGGLLAFTDKFEIVVCDPWTMEYQEIILPPSEPAEDDEDLLCTYVSAFLLDADDDDETADPATTLMWRFRVLSVHVIQHYMVDEAQRAEVYVFSARDDRWMLQSTTVADDILSALMALLKHVVHNKIDSAHAYFVGRAGGSIFLGIPLGNNVLTLDECTAEFSVLVLPEPAGNSGQAHRMQYHRGNLRAISGDVCAVRLVRIVGDYLEVLTLARDSGICVVDRRVQICTVTTISFRHSIGETCRLSWNFLDTAPAPGPGCVVLSRDRINMLMFSIETMRLVRWSEKIKNVRVFPLELPWPPTIKARLYASMSPNIYSLI